MDSRSPEAPQKTAHRGHHRHASSQRPAAARRSTRGPLDLGNDALSVSDSLRSPGNLDSPISPPPLSASPTRSHSRSPAFFPPEVDAESSTSPSSPAITPAPAAPAAPASPKITPSVSTMAASAPAATSSSSQSIPISALTHLLRPSLFHPLPPPPLPYSLPPPNTSISTLLSSGNFRAAALLSARFLSSPPPPPSTRSTPTVQSLSSPPTTAAAVFALWHVRLASLCLLGFDHVAAEESRALADVVDAPVYKDPSQVGESALPWGLRLLALRLQARVEGDAGRAVVGLYALAREARRRASQAKEGGNATDEALWCARLEDLEVRVAGTLVEMGDLEGAARMLEEAQIRHEGTKSSEDRVADLIAGRLVLLYLHIGNIERAREVVRVTSESGQDGKSYVTLLRPLVEAADGNFTAVAAEYRSNDDNDKVGTTTSLSDPMTLQNLAVCLMYAGQLDRAKELLTEMATSRSYAFPTLLFNLTTMYELTTDKARELKLGLGRSLLDMDRNGLGIETSVADLKL